MATAMETEEDESEDRSLTKLATHVLLDTKEYCFLCHHQVVSGESADEEQETWRNLRGLCGYLKICGAEVILQSLKSLRLNQEKVRRLQRNECLFWVNLCGSCGGMLEGLEQLVVEMQTELVRLWKIKRSLQALLETLGMEDAARIGEADLRNLGVCRERMNDYVVEILRKGLKHNCAEQVGVLDNIMSPRVCLTRCLVKASTIKAVGQTVSISEEGESQSSVGTQRSALVGGTTSKRQKSASPQQTRKRFAWPMRKTYRSSVKCQFCEKMLRRGDSIKRHYITHHLEQLFLDQKPAQWSLSEFQKACKRVIQEGTKILENGTNKCSYCEKTWERIENLRCHLIEFHLEILTGQLTKLEGTDPSQIEEPNQGKVCPYCKKMLKEANNVKTHCSNVHPEQLFLAWKPRHQSIEEFKASFFAVWNDLLGSCEDVSSKFGKKLKCCCCEATYSLSRTLLTHFIFEHRKVVIQKLRRQRRGNKLGTMVNDQSAEQSEMEIEEDDEEEETKLQMESDSHLQKRVESV